MFQGAMPSGGLSFTMPIPNQPGWVGTLFFAQALALPGGMSLPSRTSIVAAGTDPPKTFKVLVLNYEPIIESQGGLRLHQVAGWNDPRQLAPAYINALRLASGGFVDQMVVDWQDLDVWPVKVDGFAYTDATYLQHLSTGTGWHQPDTANYDVIISSNNVAARVQSGEIDEVFLFGGPYFGYYESRMAGPNAYWVNSPGMPWINSGRKFILMGFNYERGLAEMLHDYGHRLESIMTHVYGSWSSGSGIAHHWDRFSRYHQIAPGLAACGNTHFPPNGQSDYDYGNPFFVTCRADDWLFNWPNLQGTVRLMNSSEWGASHEGFMRWMFNHLPRKTGTNPDSRQNNWWKYTQDFNGYPHSQ
jgi:hypothetical protein